MKTIQEKNAELKNKRIKIAKVVHVGNKKRNYYFKSIIHTLKKGNRVMVETREGLKEAIFLEYVDVENFSIVHPDRFVVCRRNILKEDLGNYSIKKVEPEEMIDLKTLTENQRVKAIYVPDLAFNKSLALTYNKKSNQFIPEDNSFGFDLDHIVFDEGFEVYLIEYKENFEYDEWNWDNPTVDQEINPSKVTKLNKKEVVQFVELEKEYA